jgi:hypothetical protein
MSNTPKINNLNNMKQPCKYCSQLGADTLKGYDWYHKNCWETMPAKSVFPKEFQRYTTQNNLDSALKRHIKNGKFYLYGK